MNLFLLKPNFFKFWELIIIKCFLALQFIYFILVILFTIIFHNKFFNFSLITSIIKF